MAAGHAEVRRSRRLVLSFISTVVNYEYAFYWYFYQVTFCTALRIQSTIGMSISSRKDHTLNPKQNNEQQISVWVVLYSSCMNSTMTVRVVIFI